MMLKFFKPIRLICVLFVLSIFVAAPLWAADGEDTGTNEDATSEFQNPTQAQRAVNLAEAYAQTPDPELDAALNDVKKAEFELAQAEQDEDEAAITTARDALEKAQAAADERMAQNADVTPEEIGQMRQDGMGWGQIAHELGLHPSVLGMGHAKAFRERERERERERNGYGPGGKVSDDEIADATARNFKSGLSKGHGTNADKGGKGGNTSGRGLGKSKGKSDGSANGKGNSGKGSGGKGNGNGGGNGKK